MGTISNQAMQDGVDLMAGSYTMLAVATDVLQTVMNQVDMDDDLFEKFEDVKEYLDDLYVEEDEE